MMTAFRRVLCVSMIFCAAALPAQEKAAVNPESGREYNAGLALFTAGKHAQALDHFRKAEQLDASNTAAVFAQGLALVKLKRPKEAVERYTVVLNREPDHAKALQALPQALARAGETEKALAAYDRGIAKAPKSIEFHAGKATLLIELKRYDDAVKTLEQARVINPNNAKILETTAYVLAESGKLKEAAALAEKILASNPTNARAHVILGDNFRLARKFPEALQHYRAATKNLETKAYAEHFIETIEKEREEEEIEREFEQRQNNK